MRPCIRNSKGINPEDYPDIHKLRILADVAPYSREYNQGSPSCRKQKPSRTRQAEAAGSRFCCCDLPGTGIRPGPRLVLLDAPLVPRTGRSGFTLQGCFFPHPALFPGAVFPLWNPLSSSSPGPVFGPSVNLSLSVSKERGEGVFPT